ncbi:hypothetical protein TNCV_1981031 [Trichonephila clavipes]|nr:hypothetical protein TNCV_1981031 [Trichonephila clavipes]
MKCRLLKDCLLTSDSEPIGNRLRNFEPWPSDKDDIRACTYSSSFYTCDGSIRHFITNTLGRLWGLDTLRTDFPKLTPMGDGGLTEAYRYGKISEIRKEQEFDSKEIVRVHYFVRGGFVRHRSRASSKHLSPHLPVGSLDSSGGSNRGCAASEAARVGVESTKKPTPDVVVFET